MNIQNLKKGDVLFISDSSEKNISELSRGYAQHSYYHCALYMGSGEIIEAVKVDGVIKANISKYLNKKILAARVNESNNFLDKVILQAKEFIGFSYNDLFLPDMKRKFYCSELIHEAFNLVSKQKYFTQHKLNYISESDSSVSQYWIEFYNQYGLKAPQGQPGSHPNNLSLDNKFFERFFLEV
ncbi:MULTISPECIES: YiiX/YebB-like N1pC/P60 family cysteine hydrolase [unclassified Francisella]|uniref:YiiX/YebB-like N1pC/P60 family cysteine hydrolase n=1 Tax=unclassified Francisella TaxID=2610885 RepID=UPI002E35F5B2|nr:MULTISPECIES: YiiX/YebB-like N1pC/P60 family cysteine hydrolase [unclassified Francisella]MED7818358.1 YiiX/YebB-like N1pC/P60 family cysteine hydrolase [Francisella sp. 19S2-4]MED7829194.1 YiiX/YebB-like N1pC/P60 family cysteine hydrolase [Francisella sp. 19S2-10]